MVFEVTVAGVLEDVVVGSAEELADAHSDQVWGSVLVLMTGVLEVLEVLEADSHSLQVEAGSVDVLVWTAGVLEVEVSHSLQCDGSALLVLLLVLVSLTGVVSETVLEGSHALQVEAAPVEVVVSRTGVLDVTGSVEVELDQLSHSAEAEPRMTAAAATVVALILSRSTSGSRSDDEAGNYV